MAVEAFGDPGGVAVEVGGVFGGRDLQGAGVAEGVAADLMTGGVELLQVVGGELRQAQVLAVRQAAGDIVGGGDAVVLEDRAGLGPGADRDVVERQAEDAARRGGSERSGRRGSDRPGGASCRGMRTWGEDRAVGLRAVERGLHIHASPRRRGPSAVCNRPGRATAAKDPAHGVAAKTWVPAFAGMHGDYLGFGFNARPATTAEAPNFWRRASMVVSVLRVRRLGGDEQAVGDVLGVLDVGQADADQAVGAAEFGLQQLAADGEQGARGLDRVGQGPAPGDDLEVGAAQLQHHDAAGDAVAAGLGRRPSRTGARARSPGLRPWSGRSLKVVSALMPLRSCSGLTGRASRAWARSCRRRPFSP